MVKPIKKQRTLTMNLIYWKSHHDVENNIYYGGPQLPRYKNELLVDVWEDEEYDFETDKFVPNGKVNVELVGTNRSLRELGKYLINLSFFQTSDPDFHEHLDDISNGKGDKIVNLIIRKSK